MFIIVKQTYSTDHPLTVQYVYSGESVINLDLMILKRQRRT